MRGERILKKLFLILLILFFSIFLVSCDAFTIPSNLETNDTEQTETDTRDESLLEQQLRTIYELALESSIFEGTYEEWLETVRGPQGLPGEDGKTVVLRILDSIIQWQNEGDSSWEDLYDLSLLQGTDGITPIIEINDDGFWVINGTVTSFIAGIQESDQYVSINFDTDGGVLPNSYQYSMEIIKWTTMTLPIPTKEGYVFKGWFVGDSINDSQFYNQYPITSDITLTAKWEFDSEYGQEEVLNHFYLRKVNETSTQVTYELVLSGIVETCGFDLLVYYSNVVQYNSHVNSSLNVVANTNVNGELHFNYVGSSQNLSEEIIVTTITFDKDISGGLILEIDLVQIIKLSENGIDIIETEGRTTTYVEMIE